MLQGWISVHRQIQEHWLWADKPFSKGQAWIDMLMLANHEDKKFLYGNDLIEVSAGSFITSEVKLSERWGWSRKKVHSFLDVLTQDKMIDTKRDSKGTAIFLLNYGNFQCGNTTQEQQKNSAGTAKEQQKNTNNNDNNANNTLSYPLFCARTRESFSKFDVGLIDAKLMRKGVFVSGEEIEKMLTEFGKAETLKIYGLE